MGRVTIKLDTECVTQPIFIKLNGRLVIIMGKTGKISTAKLIKKKVKCGKVFR